MREELIEMYKTNMDMEVVELWDVELEDDDTETGGVAYKNQTVGELLVELSDSEEILDVDFKRLNVILKECGIKQIKKPKYEEDERFTEDDEISPLSMLTGKVMYLYGVMETEGRIEVGDKDLDGIYLICKEIARGWLNNEDIVGREEMLYISPYAERVLISRFSK